MTVAVGIVGAGGIGQTHGEILCEHHDADLVAVCDVDEEKARTLAGAVDAAAYADYRALFSERDLDAVYVTTPPGTRTEIVQAAAERDAAVFCEKPLAATVEDGVAIRDVVERHDVPFMIGFCSRFAEPCRLMRDVVETEIGDPVALFSHRAGYGVPDAGNWRVDPDLACGVTVESLSHNIDLLRWLGGEIASASGATANVSHPDLDGFDDNVVATVEFEDGPIGVLQNSWTSTVEYLRHGVVGTDGAVVVEGDEWWRLDRLTYATAADDYPTTVTFDAETATGMGYAAETDAFLESVAAGSVPPVDVTDGLRALEVSHAIRSDG